LSDRLVRQVVGFALTDLRLAIDLRLLSLPPSSLTVDRSIDAVYLHPGALERGPRSDQCLMASLKHAAGSQAEILIQLPLALVGQPLALIRATLPFVGQPFAFVRHAVSLVCELLALVGDSVAFVCAAHAFV
jgi:hypothetical protein